MTEQALPEGWAAAWSVDPSAAPRLIARLRRQLQQRFELDRVPPLWSPSTCGMWLLEHTNSPDGMLALPEEERRLIVGTSCQHRIELFPREGEIPAFHYYDGRARYMGLCDQEIGCGPVRRVQTDIISPSDRGRYLVSFRVPDTWQHVGLLGVQDSASRRWLWPSEPGWEGDTWADCCEVRFAISQGWRCVVREALLLTGKGRPLRAWADRLSTLYRWARQEQGGEQLAACYRAICLHTIGALHRLSSDSMSFRFVAEGEEATIPDEAMVSMVPGGYEVSEVQPNPALWRPRHSHPEWSAAIWGLAHLRLAKEMMSVPRETILGCRGDAVYLVSDPGWADDGKLGRMRRKGSLPGPLPAPRSWRELTALARRSEANG